MTFTISIQVALFIVGSVGGLVWWFTKNLISDIKEKIDHTDRKIDELEKELQHFRDGLPHRYVLRSEITQQFDAVNAGIARIDAALVALQVAIDNKVSK